MKRIITFVIFFAIGLVALSFALLNIQEVKLSYYLGSVQALLSLVMVLSLALGAVLGIVASMGLILKLKRDVSKLEKSVKVAEKEVVNLRSLPIKDEH